MAGRIGIAQQETSVHVLENHVGSVFRCKDQGYASANQIRSTKFRRMIVRVMIDHFEPFEFIDPDKRRYGGIGNWRGQGNSLPGDLGRFKLQRLAIGIHFSRVFDGSGSGFILVRGLPNRGTKCPVKTASIFDQRRLVCGVAFNQRPKAFPNLRLRCPAASNVRAYPPAQSSAGQKKFL